MNQTTWSKTYENKEWGIELFEQVPIEDRRFSIEEVFNLIGADDLSRNNAAFKKTNSVEVCGFQVYTRSLRYQTFFQKGMTCAVCGKQGTHFKLCSSDPRTPNNRKHFNLYAEDGTLMTKDHIIPKSRGGQDTVENMQTMCADCNQAKGNTSDIKVSRIVRTNGEYSQEYKNIYTAVHDILSRRGRFKNLTLIQKAIETAEAIEFAIERQTKFANSFWKVEDR